jgi:hypothetical protein
MGRMSNTHPPLATEFADYATFVGQALSEVDVASLWSASTGLAEFVRALDVVPHGTMIEPLEPERLYGTPQRLVSDSKLVGTSWRALASFMTSTELPRKSEKILLLSCSPCLMRDDYWQGMRGLWSDRSHEHFKSSKSAPLPYLRGAPKPARTA